MLVGTNSAVQRRSSTQNICVSGSTLHSEVIIQCIDVHVESCSVGVDIVQFKCNDGLLRNCGMHGTSVSYM